MKKIGFQNFRRFLEFKPIEYRNVTFLVGRNNAGKSTMVKALLLVSDFLKSAKVNSFPFGRNVLEDANIVTYDRAKNSLAKENFIAFDYQLDNFIINIKISGENDATSADVHLFSIKDLEMGFEIKLEPQKTLITISAFPKGYSSAETEMDKTLILLQEQLATAKEELKSFKDGDKSLEYFEKIKISKDIEKKITDIKKIMKANKNATNVFRSIKLGLPIITKYKNN